jgi:hypothetical protein
MTEIRMWRGAGAAAGLLLLAGCGWTGSTDIVCTDEARPAVEVAVVDSVTGEAVLEPLVWVRDGAYQDTLQLFGNTAHGAYERAGTYEVHVEHDSYAPWVRTGVTVDEDECHVITEQLTARLQAP